MGGDRRRAEIEEGRGYKIGRDRIWEWFGFCGFVVWFVFFFVSGFFFGCF